MANHAVQKQVGHHTAVTLTNIYRHIYTSVAICMYFPDGKAQYFMTQFAAIISKINMEVKDCSFWVVDSDFITIFA